MRCRPAVSACPALLVAAGLLGLVVAAPPVAAAGGDPEPGRAGRVAYVAPVAGELRRGFEPPATSYGPGHRGIDLAARPGAVVGAAADGVVAHAGSVAGATWVSIDHPDGVRTAYGPLTAPTVAPGDPVAAGEPVGTLAAGGHGHLGADDGLHLSARVDGAYIDPAGLLADRTRPSLLGPSTAAPLPVPAAGPRHAPAPAGGAPGAQVDRPPATPAAPAPAEPRAAAAGPPIPGAARAAGGRWTP